ncbi:hypothetical protein ACFHYQ_25925 [Sphaerimonospora cavernae]|uniref:Uncharacterized protein n=1 Tax=Sphaerimonospora cavernae TaxID=1740611 RepID=A0ABV6UC35_9ACTN
MPTFREVITGLTIGTALAGGIVALGAITTTTAANATVVPQQLAGGDGLALALAEGDGHYRDLRALEDLILLRNLNANTASNVGLAPVVPVARTNGNAVNIVDSFNQRIAPQRLNQRNE